MNVHNLYNIISKLNSKLQLIQFLCLSFISGMVELGSVTFLWNKNVTLLEVIGIGLSYQIGNLVPIPIKPNWLTSLLLACCSLTFFVYINSTTFNYYVFFLAISLFAGCLQLARSISKEKVNISIKRLARVLGFLCAPFITTHGFIACCLIVLIILFNSRRKIGKSELYFPKISFLHTIMITHQIHYFCYSYSILFWIMTLLSNQMLAGVIFSLGWFSYISVTFFLRGSSYIKYCVAGHLLLTSILILLAFAQKPLLIITLWILTGFGGGTVFCISKLLEKNTITSMPKSITFSENIGHVFGVFISLVLIYLSKSIFVTILVAATFSFLTVLLLLIYAHQKPLIEL
jgi:hypothetical protein